MAPGILQNSVRCFADGNRCQSMSSANSILCLADFLDKMIIIYCHQFSARKKVYMMQLTVKLLLLYVISATDVVTVYVFQEPSLLSSLQDNGLTDVVLHALLIKDVSLLLLSKWCKMDKYSLDIFVLI